MGAEPAGPLPPLLWFLYDPGNEPGEPGAALLFGMRRAPIKGSSHGFLVAPWRCRRLRLDPKLLQVPATLGGPPAPSGLHVVRVTVAASAGGPRVHQASPEPNN